MFEITKQPGKPAMARKVPSVRVMTKWIEKGVAKATDGCKVEPDGYCEHGKPSWLVYLNLV